MEIMTKSEKVLKLKYSFGIALMLLVLIIFIAFGSIPRKSSASPSQISNYTSAPILDATNQTIGEMLYQYNDLNSLAQDKDCVFLYVPADEASSVSQMKIFKAILDAQTTFKSNGINAGIYTLSSTAPEYATMSKQVPLPALLITSKGKGMAYVEGTITKDAIFKTFNEVNVETSEGCSTPSDSSTSCSPSTNSGCCPPKETKIKK